LKGEYNEGNAKLSPNSHLLAYSSDESKRREIYVQTFPEHGGKRQISASGGDYPAWSRDGRELYYISPDRKLMAVEIRGSGNSVTPGVPKFLFGVPTIASFDVSKDGRFLIQVPTEQGSTNVPLTVIINWQAGLKK
jgi:eukaryotic-like serine/threonine-protein kinase